LAIGVASLRADLANDFVPACEWVLGNSEQRDLAISLLASEFSVRVDFESDAVIHAADRGLQWWRRRFIAS
jgi:hypothetical protein